MEFLKIFIVSSHYLCLEATISPFCSEIALQETEWRKIMINSLTKDRSADID